VLCPEALRPGDRVRVIAPSGPFDRALVLRGIAWLGARYRVSVDWSLFERHGFLAGPDSRRLGELNAALRDPDARAVIAARGGYGLSRIAHRAEWAALARHPKWLVGFSDSTVLHVEASRVGVASMHADNVGSLGRGSEAARARWLRALEHPQEPRRFDQLTGWQPGRASGPLAGGNLALLFACAASGRLFIPEGAILALEDVNEAPYRVDRMLSALIISGALDRVAGVIVGDFVDCRSGQYPIDVDEVLQERLGELRVPVIAKFPFGHDRHNEPLPFGLTARIDADAGCVDLLPEEP
jgi:muramoyltetrapeptide carboxypeptidase